MNNNELVSIIMPSYNCGRYIEASIRSVEKNGCKLFAKGRKTMLGFYIITEMIEHQTGTKKINIER